MSTITLRNIKIYAFHGCMPEETVIGGNYSVDVRIKTDFTDAAHKDDLSRTVDYSKVYEIVKREMTVPSKLLENVAQRIVNALLSELRRIDEVKVRVSKLSPPINGDVESVSISLNGKRKDKSHE